MSLQSLYCNDLDSDVQIHFVCCGTLARSIPAHKAILGATSARWSFEVSRLGEGDSDISLDSRNPFETDALECMVKWIYGIPLQETSALVLPPSLGTSAASRIAAQMRRLVEVNLAARR